MKKMLPTVLVLAITSILSTLEVKSQDYRINYSVAGLDPQSMVFDPLKKKFIVSSAAQGELGYLDQKGNYKRLLKDSLLNGASRMLIRNNVLYVLTGGFYPWQSEKPIQLRLVKFDLKTKSFISVTEVGEFHAFPDKTGAYLTAGDNGTLFIVNSRKAEIYMVKSDGAISLLLANDALRDARSIVYHVNGYLLAAANKYLYKIDLATNRIKKVFLEDDFEEIHSIHFSSNHLLILAEGGVNKVHILKSNDSWTSAILARTDTSRYTNPCSIEFFNNKIFILDSQLHGSADGVLKPGDFSLRVIDLQLRPHGKRRKAKVTAGEMEIIK